MCSAQSSVCTFGHFQNSNPVGHACSFLKTINFKIIKSWARCLGENTVSKILSRHSWIRESTSSSVFLRLTGPAPRNWQLWPRSGLDPQIHPQVLRVCFTQLSWHLFYIAHIWELEFWVVWSWVFLVLSKFEFRLNMSFEFCQKLGFRFLLSCWVL